MYLQYIYHNNQPHVGLHHTWILRGRESLLKWACFRLARSSLAHVFLVQTHLNASSFRERCEDFQNIIKVLALHLESGMEQQIIHIWVNYLYNDIPWHDRPKRGLLLREYPPPKCWNDVYIYLQMDSFTYNTKLGFVCFHHVNSVSVILTVL